MNPGAVQLRPCRVRLRRADAVPLPCPGDVWSVSGRCLDCRGLGWLCVPVCAGLVPGTELWTDFLSASSDIRQVYIRSAHKRCHIVETLCVRSSGLLYDVSWLGMA